VSVRLPLSGLIYPRECVDQAVLAYAHLCSIEVSEMAPGECVIEVRPRTSNALSEDRLAHEFLNYLLDLSVESQLGRV
jgi:hypothetical protein